MSVWVIELPKKGKAVWHLEVFHSEALAHKRLKELVSCGAKGAMCWDMISGAKLA